MQALYLFNLHFNISCLFTYWAQSPTRCHSNVVFVFCNIRALWLLMMSFSDKLLLLLPSSFFFYPFADRMDLQKIIHDALYDFILSYIPHADLRWGHVGSFVWLKFFPLNPSIMPMTYFYFDQYARWRAFVLYHWGARRFGISRKCGGKLWCRGVCWNVRGLHSWFLRYWQVNLGGCLAS